MIVSLKDVKAFRNIVDGGHDAELTRLIAAVTDYLNQYCGRTFDFQDNLVEYHSGSPAGEGCASPGLSCTNTVISLGRQQLLLHNPPIISLASIFDDPLRVFGSDTQIPAANYVISDAEAGLIQLINRTFNPGMANIKVTYDGGYQEADIPGSLVQAAIELIWLARDKGDQKLLGLSAKSIADGNISLLRNDWPAGVADILDRYRLPHRFAA